MKNLILAIGIVVGLTVICSAQSQKIGYIDLQSVVRDSKAGKAAKVSFENEFKTKRDIIEQKTRALENMKQDFIKNSSVMNDSTRSSKAEQIDTKEKDLNRTREDFREALQKKDLQLTQKILKDIEGIIRKIGLDDGYTMIFERTEAGLIYGNPSADITKIVIQVYDSAK
jgi:outer membrane protein